MGFFSKKDRPKQPKVKPSTHLGPPNVFVTPSQDAANPTGSRRPANAGSKSRDKVKGKEKESRRARRTQYENASTPQVQITDAPQAQQRRREKQQPQPAQQQIQHHNCGPVIVNQHYYLGAPPDHHAGRSPYSGLIDAGNVTGSFVNLAKNLSKVPSRSEGLCAWYGYGTQVFGSTVNTFDDIAYRLNNVLTLIDNESLQGHEMDLFACRQSMPTEHKLDAEPSGVSKQNKKGRKDKDKDKQCKVQPAAEVTASVLRGNYFSKVELYANATLPKKLDPFAM